MNDSSDPNVEWVVTATPTWLHEALFLKSVLESAGIEAMIPNEYTLGVAAALLQPAWWGASTGPSRRQDSRRRIASIRRSPTGIRA